MDNYSKHIQTGKITLTLINIFTFYVIIIEFNQAARVYLVAGVGFYFKYR